MNFIIGGITGLFAVALILFSLAASMLACNWVALKVFGDEDAGPVVAMALIAFMVGGLLAEFAR